MKLSLRDQAHHFLGKSTRAHTGRETYAGFNECVPAVFSTNSIYNDAGITRIPPMNAVDPPT